MVKEYRKLDNMMENVKQLPPPNLAKAALTGLSENSPFLSSEPHLHECGQLYYCVSGTIQVSVSSGVWLVTPHRAVWIPKKIIHHSNSKRSVNL